MTLSIFTETKMVTQPVFSSSTQQTRAEASVSALCASRWVQALAREPERSPGPCLRALGVHLRDGQDGPGRWARAAVSGEALGAAAGARSDGPDPSLGGIQKSLQETLLSGILEDV